MQVKLSLADKKKPAQNNRAGINTHIHKNLVCNAERKERGRVSFNGRALDLMYVI
ncbi:MAG: hypothetical protein ACI95C_001911 [Pseudohongiellaceae bacterium]|jgi:hypothetical protein